MPPEDSFDIDWPHQLEIAKALLTIRNEIIIKYIIHGPVFPIPIPFNQEEEVDFIARDYCDHLIKEVYLS